MRILMTGGATRNKVDAIRYISANASGDTAIRLTRALADDIKHQITFLGSEVALLRLAQLEARGGVYTTAVEEFMGTRDLYARMERLVPHADVVVHSAAVGDYEVESEFGEGKIPSGRDGISLRLIPAPKILDQVRRWNPNCYLISFKAAPPSTSITDLMQIASAQLERTGSDLVFANVIGDLDRVLVVERGNLSACVSQNRYAARNMLVDRIKGKGRVQG